jgi:hypothetical protein
MAGIAPNRRPRLPRPPPGGTLFSPVGRGRLAVLTLPLGLLATALLATTVADALWRGLLWWLFG